MSTACPRYSFYDLHPQTNDFHSEIIQGLSKKPRVISPKFFYDEYGSQLFAQICETQAYYPTRTETAIIKQNMASIAKRLGTGCVLIEPGSGDSSKVRHLLDVLQPISYLPMDISSAFLQFEAQQLAAEFPWLDIHAVCTDFTRCMTLPETTRSEHRVAFFPGSTIGNFEPHAAKTFLSDVANLVGPEGGLLIGVDLIKDEEILNAAYNDEQGVTAAFNLNLLTRINRELGADFNLDQFRHHAFFNAKKSRIEMHLLSLEDQVVTIDDRCFEFSKNETIHTESSHKYTLESFSEVARFAGFTLDTVWTDPENLFSLQYFRTDK